MKIERDAWLSGIFKYDAFRVTVPESDKTDHEFEAFCFALENKKDSTFYYAKVSPASIERLHALGSAGFGIIDAHLTFEAIRPQISQRSFAEGIEIREAVAQDETEILRIAESAFIYSRFHRDPLIPQKIANEVKREWVRNYFLKQRGEALRVASLQGKLCGFLAVLKTAAAGQVFYHIDLLGVAEPFRRQGIGKALVQSFMLKYGTAGVRLRTGTQVANIPSIHLYEGFGFRLQESFFILHGHFLNGKPLEASLMKAVR